MTCDLTSGRLLGKCMVGKAGIKTLYITKFNDFDALTGVTESGGEITSLGADPITIFQFDMAQGVGNFEEISNVAKFLLRTNCNTVSHAEVWHTSFWISLPVIISATIKFNILVMECMNRIF